MPPPPGSLQSVTRRTTTLSCPQARVGPDLSLRHRLVHRGARRRADVADVRPIDIELVFIVHANRGEQHGADAPTGRDDHVLSVPSDYTRLRIPLAVPRGPRVEQGPRGVVEARRAPALILPGPSGIELKASARHERYVGFLQRGDGARVSARGIRRRAWSLRRGVGTARGGAVCRGSGGIQRRRVPGARAPARRTSASRSSQLRRASSTEHHGLSADTAQYARRQRFVVTVWRFSLAGLRPRRRRFIPSTICGPYGAP
jgi:hypothetical protein